MHTKKFHRFCIFLFFAFWLIGKVSAAAEDRIVTRVDIYYKQQELQFSRHYTDSDKMEAILNYLRLSDYAGIPPDDPESHVGSRCQIAVWLAGGDRRVYYLHAERYLSKDGHPWEQVNPPFSLLSLLQMLPGDK